MLAKGLVALLNSFLFVPVGFNYLVQQSGYGVEPLLAVMIGAALGMPICLVGRGSSEPVLITL
jgi:hypothetical protein